MPWKHVQRKDIDSARWDQIVAKSGQSIPYAHTWYLDCVAPQWRGAVLDDYAAVCALPYNRKRLGLKQLYAPFFTQQLGVYADTPIEPHALRDLMHDVRASFRFGCYHFNEADMGRWPSDIPCHQRRNTLLSLRASHDVLQAGYSKSLRKHIRRAVRAGMYVEAQTSPEAVIQYYRKHLGQKVKVLNHRTYQRLERLMYVLIDRHHAIMYRVMTPQHVCLCMGFFISYQRRLINIFAATNAQGRTDHAMAVLLDHLISEHALSDSVLDFEGSQLSGVQAYFEGFGGQVHMYPSIRFSPFARAFRP